MKRTLLILSILFPVLANSQNVSWEEFMTAIRERNDSICAIELKLEFDERSRKFGYTDSTGNFFIDPQFFCATEFIDCTALTSRKRSCKKDRTNKESWVAINKLNHPLMAPRVEVRADRVR